jgi:hypothetical protein
VARPKAPNSKIDCQRPTCLTRHERFAKCADGVRAVVGGARKGPRKSGPPVSSGTTPIAAPAKAASASGDVDATVGATGMTVEEIKAFPLITDPAEILALAPEDMKKQLLVRAEMEKVEGEWHAAEKQSDMKLPTPNILRRTNEKAARILLNQLDHTLAVAEVTKHVRDNPTADNMKKYIPEEEVLRVKETLAEIPQMRDDKRHEEEDRERRKTHVNGTALWVCENEGSKCYHSGFRAASLDLVRRKAQAEPGWIFACPRCKGTKVRLADLQEVA